MNNTLINTAKEFVNMGDIYSLKKFYKEEYHQTNKENGYHNNEYFWKTIFTHACVKRQLHIAKWLYEIYMKEFDQMTQCALRHTFNYCHATMDGKRHPHFKSWLHKIVMENRQKFSVK